MCYKRVVYYNKRVKELANSDASILIRRAPHPLECKEVFELYYIL
jgi:hypothetical protein